MSDAPAPRCPWCSAVLESANQATCSSCGAHLVETADVAVPGVTSVDTDALTRAPQRAPGGLVGLIAGGGEDVDEPTEDELPALAPPDEEVRREMLRLELEAELVSLTAEAHAIAAERGIPLEELEAEVDEAGGSSSAPAGQAGSGHAAQSHPGEPPSA